LEDHADFRQLALTEVHKNNVLEEKIAEFPPVSKGYFLIDQERGSVYLSCLSVQGLSLVTWFGNLRQSSFGRDLHLSMNELKYVFQIK